MLAEKCLDEGVPDFAVEPMLSMELEKARPGWNCDDATAELVRQEYVKGFRDTLDEHRRN